ncbi:MAG: small subunit ribosomal protein S17 [Chlamydiales bacterium]|jgi:small subunit ribosomal protein S17
MTDERNRRRTASGVVTSAAMDKSISVRVERIFKHPRYKKYIRRHSTYHAHDENNDSQIGDTVDIMECRPVSKLKRWRLMRVVNRSDMASGSVS